jgi:hypothetical protein
MWRDAHARRHGGTSMSGMWNLIAYRVISLPTLVVHGRVTLYGVSYSIQQKHSGNSSCRTGSCCRPLRGSCDLLAQQYDITTAKCKCMFGGSNITSFGAPSSAGSPRGPQPFLRDEQNSFGLNIFAVFVREHVDSPAPICKPLFHLCFILG